MGVRGRRDKDGKMGSLISASPDAFCWPKVHESLLFMPRWLHQHISKTSRKYEGEKYLEERC